MPRTARSKYPGAIYHVMCRSISELLLFNDDADKWYYLRLLKKYLEMYHCSLYAYCLMNTHVHMHLDPKGFDISKFMHSVNTAYVRYYNKKYLRHGHLFQDRFVSKILSSDEYNLAVSAYIHNNPKKIVGFSGNEEAYEFSSYGIYLGIMPDYYEIVDTRFIKSLFNLCDQASFAKRYNEFVKKRQELEENSIEALVLPLEAEYKYLSGRTVMIREQSIPKVISYISHRLGISQQIGLSVKAWRKLTEYRAVTAYALRVLCNLSYREICTYLVNITITSCSRLCHKGFNLVNKDSNHMQMFNDLTAIAI